MPTHSPVLNVDAGGSLNWYKSKSQFYLQAIARRALIERSKQCRCIDVEVIPNEEVGVSVQERSAEPKSRLAASSPSLAPLKIAHVEGGHTLILFSVCDLCCGWILYSCRLLDGRRRRSTWQYTGILCSKADGQIVQRHCLNRDNVRQTHPVTLPQALLCRMVGLNIDGVLQHCYRQ